MLKKEEPIKVPEELAKRVKAMSDDELFVELKVVVNDARNKPSYDRAMARAVAAEFHNRGVRLGPKGKP